ncbi:MAG: hypothetical protein HUU29_12410 [Planctomycetaceae bacterium]|nr:hypothetical protein [Planctomycetaceae bacterium]
MSEAEQSQQSHIDSPVHGHALPPEYLRCIQETLGDRFGVAWESSLCITDRYVEDASIVIVASGFMEDSLELPLSAEGRFLIVQKDEGWAIIGLDGPADEYAVTQDTGHGRIALEPSEGGIDIRFVSQEQSICYSLYTSKIGHGMTFSGNGSLTPRK